MTEDPTLAGSTAVNEINLSDEQWRDVRMFGRAADLPPPWRRTPLDFAAEQMRRSGELLSGYHVGRESHVHWALDVKETTAMSRLRRMFQSRPPLYGPVPRSALLVGELAVVETRSRLRSPGGAGQERPAREVAAAVLDRAAPFIQQETLRLVAGDRAGLNGWWVVGQVACVSAGLLAGLVSALVSGSVVVAAVLGAVLLAHVWSLLLIRRANLGQVARAEAALRDAAFGTELSGVGGLK